MNASELFGDYTRWLRVNVPRAYENLAPRARGTDLAELEQILGQRLPDAVRDVLRVHNGQVHTDTDSHDDEDAVPCLPGLSFLSTTLIGQVWLQWERVRRTNGIDELQSAGDVMPGAEDRVRPLYTSPGWIPLWADPARSDYIGLDLDPDSNGIPGQIINFGRDELRHFIVADTFAELLQILLDEVRSGRWQASTTIYDEEEDERTVPGHIDDPDGRPWFGTFDDHFFNALHDRAMHRSSTRSS